MFHGVFTQSDDSGEYVGFSPSAEDVHQVNEIDVRVSDGLKYLSLAGLVEVFFVPLDTHTGSQELDPPPTWHTGPAIW